MNTFSKKNRWLITLGLAGAAVLAGCGKKPPGCAEPETVKTINSIVVDNVKELMPQYIGTQTQDDPQKIQDGYYQGLKTEVVNVVSDGYNERAKKYSCRANLSITPVTGEKFSRDIVYSTQRTEDKESNFLVEVQAFQPFVVAVAGDLTTYYFGKRYKGEWKGDYSCSGVFDAKDGPDGPFTMPVTMVVDEKQGATLERTTEGGDVERMTGEVRPQFTLGGQGKNSLNDNSWRTYFEGKVQGLDFTAQGQFVGPDNSLLRKCSLKLKLPTN